ELEEGSVRVDLDAHGGAGLRAGMKDEVEDVLVGAKGADGGTVVVAEVVPRPAGAVWRAAEEAVIGDDVAADAADAGLLKRIGDRRERALVIPVEETGGHGEVTTPVDDERPAECASGRNMAARDDVGDDAKVRPEGIEGEGGGEQLRVGGRL